MAGVGEGASDTTEDAVPNVGDPPPPNGSASGTMLFPDPGGS